MLDLSRAPLNLILSRPSPRSDACPMICIASWQLEFATLHVRLVLGT